ncbi:MAG: class D beta-lactamase, partial [Pseudomonadales bacterium]|nr:class D beta-lactamase [Pseudomonadales bacterium]
MKHHSSAGHAQALPDLPQAYPFALRRRSWWQPCRVWVTFLLTVFITFSVPQVSHGETIKPLPEARELIARAGYGGQMLIYDEAQDTWWASEPDAVNQRYIPASTFKIMSSLVILEAGTLPDTQTLIPWDGVTRSRSVINQDLNLRDAFQYSALPHYQQLVRQTGAETMQKYIDLTGYGNRDISGRVDLFWILGPLRISPREQI